MYACTGNDYRLESNRGLLVDRVKQQFDMRIHCLSNVISYDHDNQIDIRIYFT